MAWLFYKRGTIHPYRAYVALMGINRRRLHPVGVKHPRTFYINEGEKLYWAWEEDDLRIFWRHLIAMLQIPRRVTAYFRVIDRQIIRALWATEHIRKMNLRPLVDQDLLKLFADLETAVTPSMFALNSEIDVVDLYLEDWLRARIEQELKTVSSNQARIISQKLIQPISRTYVNREEIMIMRAAQRHDFSDQTLRRIYNKFWWTNLGWENVRPRSLDYFRQSIRKQARIVGVTTKLAQAENFVLLNQRERRQYLKFFRASSPIKYWLSIYDRYVYYHDRRKELQGRINYAFYLLLSEVARRRRLKVADLEWLWHFEVKNILQGGSLDQAEIRRRKKGVAALVYFNKFTVWSGIAAIRLRRKYVKEEKQKIFEFSGLGVSGGLVRGRVKVCAGAKEALLKIKQDDILVCPMTTPEHVIAMRRAKAIITDEGGITCHAAIIAREFGIPCIVGTKTATRILSDGDLIEADARNGLVKFIK
ncbi:MAG: PEP-utilizing enzyme [Patescibacteria group bacterium]